MASDREWVWKISQVIVCLLHDYPIIPRIVEKKSVISIAFFFLEQDAEIMEEHFYDSVPAGLNVL